MMQLLLTFDSAPFIKHLTNTDDRRMIDFIIKEYGLALEYAISYFNEDTNIRILTHYQDAYFKSILTDGNAMSSNDSSSTWRARVIDDEGNVNSAKARYDELVEVITNTFNQQCVAVLRGIQSQAKRIYTVDVLGYADNCLKLLLKTDGVHQP